MLRRCFNHRHDFGIRSCRKISSSPSRSPFMSLFRTVVQTRRPKSTKHAPEDAVDMQLTRRTQYVDLTVFLCFTLAAFWMVDRIARPTRPDLTLEEMLVAAEVRGNWE
eukprot:219733_1